tara:strand:+ start:7567 stop:8778 length:1212 start_codon:yes stop_codon:yes gene_type:complete
MTDVRVKPDDGKGLEHYARLLEEAHREKGISLWRDAWRRLRRNKASMVSLVFLVLLSISALLTPLLPLQSPVEQHLGDGAFQAPNTTAVSLPLLEMRQEYDDTIAQLEDRLDAAGTAKQRIEIENEMEATVLNSLFERYWNKPGPTTRRLIRLRISLFGDWSVPSLCGTDNLGRDVFSRLFWGARVSLIVGIVATFVSLLIGVSYGATAGYVGGGVDRIMMRIVDVFYSVPFIFVVIFLITILDEPSIKGNLEQIGIDRITIFYFLIGAIYWLTMARVVRGQIISLKNEQFVEAARTIGASRVRIIFRHLVPNVMGIVIVYLTLTIPAVMRFEAFLSFLGIGVAPPDVSWGLLVNEGLQDITPIKIYWWSVTFSGLALAMTLFALSFLGDGLRDALDPRMKNR